MNKEIKVKAKTLATAILLVAGTGTLAATALMAPNALQILRPFIGKQKGRKAYERERIRQELKRLARRRLVELYQKGDNLFLSVTEKGKQRMRKLEFDSLQLEQPSHWDKKWRVIIFDIPERHKKARYTFHFKLKELGFYPLQKSVFVFPFECRDEIDFLTSFCVIRPFVRYIETNDLDSEEGRVRKFFNLL